MKPRGPWDGVTRAGARLLGDPDVRRALVLAWGVVSVLGLGGVLCCWALPAGWILGVAPRCWSMVQQGVPCSLCGMTRAFLALSHGELGRALELNRAAPWLYAGLLVNGAGACARFGVWGAKWMFKRSEEV